LLLDEIAAEALLFPCSLLLPHLLESLSLRTPLLKLNSALNLSLIPLLSIPCFLEFLLHLISLTNSLSSSGLSQLARRPEDSATVVLLALLKVKSFALLLMLLFIRERLS
jgi:hypothetical protein